jgi:hypothetical protein
LKICGLRVDFTEGQGANYKIGGDFPAWNFFQWENIVDSVHHPWTVGGTNPGYTADGASAVARQRLASRPLRSKGAHQRECNRERGTQGS